MFRHGLHSDYSTTAATHWFLLSALAGTINAGSYMACQTFVTHITGFATMTGVAIAEGNISGALAALTVPLFFLAGVMIAAWLTTRRVQIGSTPRYAQTMLLVTACLVAAPMISLMESQGRFGDRFTVNHDYLLVAMLCMASGMLNGAITASSGGTIRATHLTGLVTDLGIGMIDSITRGGDESRIQKTRRRNRFRLGTLAAFMCGSVAGALLFVRVGYRGFFAPAAVAFYAAIVGYRGQKAPPDEAQTV